MTEYNITQKQYDTLLGLRHWLANKAYMIERYPADYEKERERIHKTIVCCFNEADQLHIPFWVQNIICGYQDNWRHTLDTYLYQDLEKRGVNCDAVSCR